MKKLEKVREFLKRAQKASPWSYLAYVVVNGLMGFFSDSKNEKEILEEIKKDPEDRAMLSHEILNFQKTVAALGIQSTMRTYIDLVIEHSDGYSDGSQKRELLLKTVNALIEILEERTKLLHTYTKKGDELTPFLRELGKIYLTEIEELKTIKQAIEATINEEELEEEE